MVMGQGGPVILNNEVKDMLAQKVDKEMEENKKKPDEEYKQLFKNQTGPPSKRDHPTQTQVPFR